MSRWGEGKSTLAVRGMQMLTALAYENGGFAAVEVFTAESREFESSIATDRLRLRD